MDFFRPDSKADRIFFFKLCGDDHGLCFFDRALSCDAVVNFVRPVCRTFWQVVMVAEKRTVSAQDKRDVMFSGKKKARSV